VGRFGVHAKYQEYAAKHPLHFVGRFGVHAKYQEYAAKHGFLCGVYIPLPDVYDTTAASFRQR
jgi:hypothetical protein